jgi:hypothetical protein
MAGKTLPLLFGDGPVEIVDNNFEYTGKFKHDPDPLKERTSRRSARWSNDRSATSASASTETPTDDPRRREGRYGQLRPAHRADGAVFLQKKPKSAVVYDLRSSRVVMEEIIKYGGPLGASGSATPT